MNPFAFLAAASCLSAQSVGQSPTLSYETEGKALREIVRELSQQSGVRLGVSPDLGSDILALRVRERPLSEIKDQLAQIEHADWQSQDGVTILRQTQEEFRGDYSAHGAYIEQGFESALQTLRKELAKQPAFDETGATLFARKVDTTLRNAADPRSHTLALKALEALSPSYRAAVRILTTLGSQTLSELPPRLKTYFSNQPTAGERPLPDSSMEAVDTFLSEQGNWAKASGSFSLPSNLPPFLANRKAPTGYPSKILLSLYRESIFGRIFVDLNVADSAGHVIARATASISPALPIPTSAVFMGTGGPHPLTVGPKAIQVTGMGSGKSADSEVRQALLQPEQVEPLSIAYGSTLLQLVKNENVDLVANLSDKLLDGYLRQPKYISSEQYLENLAKKGQQSGVQGGWLILAPVDLVVERQDRADRIKLGEYLRGTAGQGLSIEQEADFALALPDPIENMLAPTLMSRIQNAMVGLKDVSLLRFYGSLSPEQREQAQSAEGLHLADLSSPNSLEFLNEIVYARTNPLIIPRNIRPEIWREPSECLANGLDHSSVLHLNEMGKPAVFDLDRDKQPFQINAGSVSAAEVAFSQFQQRHPEKFPSSAPSHNGAAHYKLGQLMTYVFDFRLAPDVWTDCTLEGRSLPSGDPLTLDQLPSWFLEEVSKSLAETEKADASVAPTPNRPKSSSTP